MSFKTTKGNTKTLVDLRVEEFCNYLINQEDPRTFTRKSKNINRNDRCPCNSGKKYKRCCLEVWGE